ncbi:MAG: hypothetical protein JO146_04455 [Candidatus Eremiobacteraeota bacterium]|nr:hypothetical protein [Candidatus Eremiobacteraeota bacterium]
MRYASILISVLVISGCSQGLGSIPSPSTPLGTSSQPNASGPKITKISKIEAKQYQKIVISGSGFGTMAPYNGDSAYLQILDTTGGWSAGLDNSSQDDTVTLDVTSWSNKKIVITGFTGGYGESGWVLNKGDNLTVNVWNAQNGNGPGTINTKVK